MQNKTEKEKLYKYFDIKENSIICKYETRIELNTDEYKINDEEVSDMEESSDQGDSNEEQSLNYVYHIVGIFEAFIPEFNDTVQFSLPYTIEINKTEDTLIKNNTLFITYEPGTPLLFATNKETGTNLNIITKQLDNTIKYLHGDVSKSVELFWEELAKTAVIKLHHAELVFTILYGEDTVNGFVPVRLGSREYTKDNAIGSKDSAHNFGSSQALNFGYSNDAILKNVTRPKNMTPQKSDLEKIIAAEYHNLNIKEEI